MVSGVVDPEVEASMVWGIVGGLAFLVLVQTYHLVGGAFVGITVMAGMALLVAAVTAASAHVLQKRLSWSVAESESP
ncbi:MAG: hypothetical protein V5A25_02695 [Halovenus sp.]